MYDLTSQNILRFQSISNKQLMKYITERRIQSKHLMMLQQNLQKCLAGHHKLQSATTTETLLYMYIHMLISGKFTRIEPYLYLVPALAILFAFLVFPLVWN